MCGAVLNVGHFEGRWVWLSFNINFYKDGTPQASTSVHKCLYHTCTHRGRGDALLNWFVHTWECQKILSFFCFLLSSAKISLFFSSPPITILVDAWVDLFWNFFQWQQRFLVKVLNTAFQCHKITNLRCFIIEVYNLCCKIGIMNTTICNFQLCFGS